MKSIRLEVTRPRKFVTRRVCFPWLSWLRTDKEIRTTYSCPESMNEMSLKQLYTYIRTVYRRKGDIYVTDKDGNVTIQDTDYYNYACFVMLRCLLGIPKAEFMALSDEQVTDLLGYNIIDFAMNGTNNLTRNHIPVFYALGRKYYGPANQLANVSLMEFAMADVWYNRYWASGKVEELDQMIGCLYRPAKENLNTSAPDYDGDRRQKFNQYLVDSIAVKTTRLSLKKKLVILLFFVGCRNQMEVLYPHLFKRKEETDKGSGDWSELIISMSNNDVTAIERVAEVGVHSVFKTIDLLAKRKPEQ